jgi:hypothetical protein
MEQSLSLKTNSSSAGKAVPCKVWTMEFYEFVYKNPQSVAIMSQLNPLSYMGSILVLSSHLRLDLLSGIFHKFSVPRRGVNLSWF